MKYAAVLVTALLALGAQQQQPQGPTPEFCPSGWVNTTGYELENLKGKVVILYFFEEG
jgi:hypothetical protein